MAILKTDLKRVNIFMPKQLLEELNAHIKKFDTDRSMWLREAAKEKLIKEKIMLEEIFNEEESK